MGSYWEDNHLKPDCDDGCTTGWITQNNLIVFLGQMNFKVVLKERWEDEGRIGRKSCMFRGSEAYDVGEGKKSVAENRCEKRQGMQPGTCVRTAFSRSYIPCWVWTWSSGWEVTPSKAGFLLRFYSKCKKSVYILCSYLGDFIHLSFVKEQMKLI